MKRSRLIRAIITSLLALPCYVSADRTIRRAPKKEMTAIAPLPLETNILTQFAQPVTLTPDGIKKFLRHTYNHYEYGLDFLPNNFSHLLQFLRKGKESHQKRAYVQSVFRLFSNKLKSSQYVNAYAFSNVIEELPKLIGDYFLTIKTKKDLEAIQAQINEILYSRFLSQFKSFKSNPDDFLKILSADIATTVDQQEVHQTNDPVSIEELRKTMLAFLEVGLGKLIWNPEDQDDTWLSIKHIANDLSALYEHSIIIDQDDLNDLYRTLIERYCFFIEITGEDLPIEFFDRVKKDINNQSLLFLDLEEEEDVESKSDRLLGVLTRAHQKALIKRERERKKK